MFRISFFCSLCLHLVLLCVSSTLVAQWATPAAPQEKRFRVELQALAPTTAGVAATGSTAGRSPGEPRRNAVERLSPPSPGDFPEIARKEAFTAERLRPLSPEFTLPPANLQKMQRIEPAPLSSLAPPLPNVAKSAPNLQTVQPVTPAMQEFTAKARDFPTPLPKKSTPMLTQPQSVSAKAMPLPANPPPVATPPPVVAPSNQVAAGIPETRAQPESVATPGNVTTTTQTPRDASTFVADAHSAAALPADVRPSSRPGTPGATPGVSANVPGAGGDPGNAPDAQAQAHPSTPREKTLLNQYLQEIAAKIAAVRQYPKNARTEGWEGTVLLKLRIVASGQVEKVELIAKSKYESLNEAALQAIRKAQPFPPFSRGLTLQAITVNIPIRFTLAK